MDWKPELRWCWVPLAAVLIVACGESDDDTSGDDDSSSTLTPGSSPTPVIAPSLTLGDWQASVTEPGVIEIAYTLVGRQGLTLDLTATYSRDGMTFYDATAFGDVALTGVEASPEGSTYTFPWNTLADLGFLDGDVWFRLAGQGDGYDVGPETVKVTVANVQYDKPCVVAVDPPTQEDGQIPVTYHLLDQAGDTCNVSVTVRLVEGGADNPATPSATNPGDPLSDVEVPPEGITRQFVWDSEADIGQHDMDVILTVTATDENNTESASVSFTVKNDPTPDPGEFIFTEIMFRPGVYGYPYVELYNTTNHRLDLQGVHLDSKSASVVISDTSLQVAPRTFFVISQTSTDYNAEWTDLVLSDFNMHFYIDQLEMWLGDPEDKTSIDVAHYDTTDEASPDVEPGQSLGLLAPYMTAGANDALGAWCAETQPISTFPEGSEDRGTPGAPTACTAESTPTTTPTPEPAATPVTGETPTPAPVTPTPAG